MSQTRQNSSAAELLAELAHFTGDCERYRHSLNRSLIYTPGVRHLAEKAGAYWLIDAIASHVGAAAFRQEAQRDPRVQELHFWRLEVAEDNSAVLSARADSGERPFLLQRVPFTDFPIDQIDLWVAFDGRHYTLYLPSEH